MECFWLPGFPPDTEIGPRVPGASKDTEIWGVDHDQGNESCSFVMSSSQKSVGVICNKLKMRTIWARLIA